MKKLFILLALVVLPHIAFNQYSVSNYRSELNIKLEVIDEKRLDKGVEILNEAVVTEYEALAMLEVLDDSVLLYADSKDYYKMMKRFQEASDQYYEGHTLIYMVYEENCGKFKEEMKKINHYASGMNKAKYYKYKGAKRYKKAASIRAHLYDADKPEWVQYKMHEALELEKLAIRAEGRALQIMQDFPVEYNYEWDDDVTPEVLAEYFKNPVIKLPPDEVFKKVPVEERIEPEEGFVEFRVQIAAHTVQIANDYIKTFYTGNDSIRESHEGTWFKYQLGSFDNYKQADSLRTVCRVPRAFIVAYQEENKITIKEALAIIQKNQ